MDLTRGEPTASRFDELHAEATGALAYAGNILRGVRDRYRAAYLDDLSRFHDLADDLGRYERDGTFGSPDPMAEPSAAEAAEAGAADLRLRMVRDEVDRSRGDLARHEAELSRLGIAIRNLEHTWLFVERDDNTLVGEPSLPVVATELQMRILEAQEAERARLAQEVHDGPAQALSNAIFQVDFIDRIFDTDPRMAQAELRFLRELLRRELGDVRSFLNQLRPPVLAELGLYGAVVDTVTTQATLSGLHITTELGAPTDGLDEPTRTVVLRIAQEALQNALKHAHATRVAVTLRADDGRLLLEVADDGVGFDPDAAALRARRLGLTSMRERAERVGGTLDIRSGESGTTVRLEVVG
jgi:two-component system, NarL family, sensor histidine kinase DegS